MSAFADELRTVHSSFQEKTKVMDKSKWILVGVILVGVAIVTVATQVAINKIPALNKLAKQ